MQNNNKVGACIMFGEWWQLLVATTVILHFAVDEDPQESF